MRKTYVVLRTLDALDMEGEVLDKISGTDSEHEEVQREKLRIRYSIGDGTTALVAFNLHCLPFSKKGLPAVGKTRGTQPA